MNAWYVVSGGAFLVLWQEKEIVGCVGLKKRGECCDQKTGQIKRFAIAKELRHQGYGTWLLQNILRIAREKNYTLLKLATGSNEKAKGLYEKAGFRLIGRDPRNDDYLMECIL